MKSKKIVLCFLFIGILVLNFVVRPVKSNTGITLSFLTNIAMAGGESGSSNDPVAVGTISIGDGSSTQYYNGINYCEYSQNATKYYDPKTGSYFYKVNEPDIHTTCSQPFSGSLIQSPLPAGAIFY
jgi:hypothetical protein